VIILKLDRLVSILVILLRKERVQAKELAERFGVSVRTILRDVDAINLAGIPIVTYQGVNGGIGIAEGYRLDKSVLTSDDVAAILTALNGISSTIPDSRHEILVEKFRNTLSPPQLEMLDMKTKQLVIDLSPWGGKGEDGKRLSAIRKAIEDHNLIEFTYINFQGISSSRTVEPYSLVLKGQKWYLYAWCMLREDFRFFKLSRIRDMNVLNRAYILREVPIEDSPWNEEWHRSENLIEIELLFERNMEAVVCEWFEQDLQICDDGRIMVNTEFPENNWLYGFILSFGTAVEVVSPPHIRRIISQIGEQIYKKYLE
jgi:predicted DNA-binding transcriptional regulator YafY